MYPLSVEQPYAREHWYVAGLSADFARTPRGRTILDQPLVLFRTEAGEPVALWGLCPHRLLPLEMGRLTGDTLVCGYHGFSFDSQGQCISIPTAGRTPPSCRLKAYPVVERGPLVWIWMGQGPADFSRLPDAADIGLGEQPQGWRVDVTEAFALKARAQLLIDNLMDLSHLAFVHSQSVPGGGAVCLVEPTTEESGQRLKVTRRMTEEAPSPLTLFLDPEANGPVEVELMTDAYNHCLINAGGWRRPASMDRGTLSVNYVHIITPETPTTTHYFGLLTRNFRLDDKGLSAALTAQNDSVRAEDVTVLEAIEAVADKHGDRRKEVSIRPDAGALLMRFRIETAIRAENGASAERAREGRSGVRQGASEQRRPQTEGAVGSLS